MNKKFVHLHVHSDYSMLDGACRIDKLVKRVKGLGQSAIAITDHGNMFGVLDLYKHCKKEGVKAILGCEFYMAPAGIKNRADKSRYHLILLAKNYEGYQNLCRLNEVAWGIDGFYGKPRIDRESLRKYSKNLICLSACIGGEIPSYILENNDVKARESIEFFIDVFGKEDFYFELQYHSGYESENDFDYKEFLEKERFSNNRLREFSKEYGIGVVCTNDAHYLEKENSQAHDALLCIGTQSMVSDSKRMRFSGNQFYVKSTEEMAEIFADCPEALENSVKIADKCNFILPKDENHYPFYFLHYAKEMAEKGFAPKLPEISDDPQNKHCPVRLRYLEEICFQGLKKRYNLLEPENLDYEPKNADEPSLEKREEIFKRMKYELGIIDKMGFVSYFLVVWDFINYANSLKIPVGPGRGSGAGSLVAYLTGITDLDPLRYNLLFERFLNPDRISPPDFDIDFCERRRGEVIDYVRAKYGDKSVAQIGTFGTLKAKAVVKDVARVMGISFADSNRLTGLIDADLELKESLAKIEYKEFISVESWGKRVTDTALVLEGLNRNQSIHACGVIIGDQELANVVPIASGGGGSAEKREKITQFPAKPCEQLGLLKMDFLGLKTLTIIQDALDMINKKSGGNLTPNDFPLDDKKTYKLLNRGETVGVFQLESDGMRKVCRKMGVDKIDEIIALVALYRPGPLEFIDPFIDCKFGRAKPDYDTESMELLLSETYGIMVYQEQIMQIVQVVAGFSLAQADIMRRAIGKKDEKTLIEQKEKFVDGCGINGTNEEIANKIWEKILKFANYGFNKSHAACYAIMAYRTAYLKANYPAEFMTAILNSEINNNEKLTFYIGECKEMGINVLPPDINVSKENFSVDGKDIRFGIAGLKGVGEAAAKSIIDAQKDGRFKSLIDFCERVGAKVNKRVMESLCKAGGFDCFENFRSQIFEVIEQALAMAAQTVKDRELGQGNLFGDFGDCAGITNLNFPKIKEWELTELLSYEKELLGIYLSGHPLGEFLPIFKSYSIIPITKIIEKPQKDMPIFLVGMLKTLKIVYTKKDNKKMAIITIEDSEKSVDAVLFAKGYEKFGDLLEVGKPIFITGFIDVRDEIPQILVEEIYLLDDMFQKFTLELQIRVRENETTAEQMRHFLEICKKYRGAIPIILCATCEHGHAFIEPRKPLLVNLCAEFRDEVKNVLGVKSLHYKSNKSLLPQKRQAFQPRKATE